VNAFLLPVPAAILAIGPVAASMFTPAARAKQLHVGLRKSA
jgi:hypothetical protein